MIGDVRKHLTAIGTLAVWLLERRDLRRARDPGWRRRVQSASERIQTRFPGIPSDAAHMAAREYEEGRFTPLVWLGIVVGCFSLICGAAMIVVRVIQFFSAK